MRAKETIIRTCQICGKEFEHNNKYFEKKCCSPECMGILLSKRDNRIYKVDDTFLRKESPNKYYLLGLMAADGCIFDKSNKWGIHLGLSGDVGLQLLEHVRYILGCTHPITSYQPSVGMRSYNLSFTSKRLHEDFIKNGVVPRKTKVFSIPEYILQDEQKLRYFIIGYIDGDGCVGLYHTYKSNKGVGKTLDISLACCDNMAEQLKQSPYFTEACICKGENGSIWQVLFNGRKAIRFGQWLYENMDESVFKSYKYQHYKDYMDNRYELTPGLRQKELHDIIQKDLDINPLMTPKQIQEKYGVTKRYSEHQTWLWRQHNNISYEECLQKYGKNK